MTRSAVFMVVLLTLSTVVPLAPPAQDTTLLAWARREYGIGVVRYADMYRYETRDVLYSSPVLTADTVAVLDQRELCFRHGPHCVFSYKRMIEFDYEIPGWAILSLTRDSSWAEVTLNPWTPDSAPTAWVYLARDSVSVVFWRDLLPTKWLFFPLLENARFYARPDRSAPVALRYDTLPNPPRADLIMRPLRTDGRWMQVEVFSPNPLCKWPRPEVTPDTAWIEYLTSHDRPRVFYYTRGC
jgi:hypothetical protein